MKKDMIRSRFKTLVFFTYFILFNIHLQSQDCIPEQDSLFLLELDEEYQLIEKYGWDILEPMSTWFGISLNDDGCVDGFSIYDSNCEPFCDELMIIGVFPSILLNIPFITEIDISVQMLQGPIPPDIDDLCLLTKFDISDNEFDGALPASIAGLENLQELDVSNNLFEGTYPSEYVVLCQLDSIFFESNNLPSFINFCNNGVGSTTCIFNTTDILSFENIAEELSSICGNIYDEGVLSDMEVGTIEYNSIEYLYIKKTFENVNNQTTYYKFYGCGGIKFETVIQGEFYITERGLFTASIFENLNFSTMWNCTLYQPYAVISYQDDFDGETPINYSFESFEIDNPTGFSSFAVHSEHPYNSTDTNDFADTSYFKPNFPIIIDSENHFISFNEVVLIEPGDSNGFYDFAIVEGRQSNSSTWLPLVDMYDSRDYLPWLNAYENTSDGNENLFRKRTIDLTFLDHYEAGDTIEIRFLLHSDALEVGWGWTIDNLDVQLQDADNDGYNSFVDCNDNNPDINPGATEILDNNIDENCDGIYCYDFDVEYNADLLVCVGESNGFIDLLNLNNFELNWSDGSSDTSISNLGIGSHYVTLTDSEGCSISDTFNVVETVPMDVDIATNDVECFGDSTGRINLEVTGDEPFEFDWSNGNEGTLDANLNAGAYFVTITDNNGCTFISDSLIINSPEPLVVELQVVEDTTSIVSAIISGGIEPYNYQWSTGESTETINVIAEGEYSLTIVDSNGCFIMSTVFVSVTSISPFIEDEQIIIYPNPAEDVINISIENGIHLDVWEIYNSSGHLILSGEKRVNQISLAKFNSGLYFIKFKFNDQFSFSPFVKY